MKTEPEQVTKKDKIIGVIVLAVIFFFVFGVFNQSSSPTTASNSPNSPSAPVEQKETDAGWKAVDDVFKTREGVIVEEDDGRYEISRRYKDFWDEKRLVNNSLTDFVNVSKQLYRAGAKGVTFTSLAEFTDSRGNTSWETVAKFDASKKEFDAYKWDNLQYREIGSQLIRDEVLVDWHLSLVKDDYIQKAAYNG